MDRLDVVPEALSLSESHPAMNALKWLFAVMDSLVIFPRFFLIKCLRTMWALKVADHQMVPFDVLVQSSSPRPPRSVWYLWTLRANKRLLDTVLILHVTSKPNVMMKDFTANITFNAQLVFMRFQM